MPEEIELDSDKLRETIDKEIEHENSGFLRRVALSTALFAAFAAVVAMQAGDTVNEALVLKTEATRLQAQASDQWAFYQAKGIKASVADAGAQSWLSVGKPAPAALTDRVAKENNDQKEIRQKAEELEHERDAKSAEADHLLQRHHLLANAVALLQVSIALGAVAALQPGDVRGQREGRRERTQTEEARRAVAGDDARHPREDEEQRERVPVTDEHDRRERRDDELLAP
jgi:hypothetical protein